MCPPGNAKCNEKFFFKVESWNFSYMQSDIAWFYSLLLWIFLQNSWKKIIKTRKLCFQFLRHIDILETEHCPECIVENSANSLVLSFGEKNSTFKNREIQNHQISMKTGNKAMHLTSIEVFISRPIWLNQSKKSYWIPDAW